MKYKDWGMMKTQCVYPPILDELDCVLAVHYRFPEEEAGLVINHDIKYRMGRGEADDE